MTKDYGYQHDHPCKMTYAGTDWRIVEHIAARQLLHVHSSCGHICTFVDYSALDTEAYAMMCVSYDYARDAGQLIEPAGRYLN